VRPAAAASGRGAAPNRSRSPPSRSSSSSREAGFASCHWIRSRSPLSRSSSPSREARTGTWSLPPRSGRRLVQVYHIAFAVHSLGPRRQEDDRRFVRHQGCAEARHAAQEQCAARQDGAAGSRDGGASLCRAPLLLLPVRAQPVHGDGVCQRRREAHSLRIRASRVRSVRPLDQAATSTRCCATSATSRRTSPACTSRR